jgi:ligand-binding SRPBCC domain-containing protein
VHSASRTRERAVSGVTSGLIGGDEEVEWRARHFGLWLKLRVRITGFREPDYFQDSMVEGPFRSFTHDHDFAPQDSGTLMKDRIVFSSSIPVIDRFILHGHLRHFVQHRNLQLKAALESDQWQAYLQSKNR